MLRTICVNARDTRCGEGQLARRFGRCMRGEIDKSATVAIGQMFKQRGVGFHCSRDGV